MCNNLKKCICGLTIYHYDFYNVKLKIPKETFTFKTNILALPNDPLHLNIIALVVFHTTII